jgi:hypothetical protein
MSSKTTRPAISQALANAGAVEEESQAEQYRPDDWESVRRHGDPSGAPESRFDPDRGQYYSVGRDGEILWEAVPAGYRLNKEGLPEPLEAAPAADPKSTPATTPAGAPATVKDAPEEGATNG